MQAKSVSDALVTLGREEGTSSGMVQFDNIFFFYVLYNLH